MRKTSPLNENVGDTSRVVMTPRVSYDLNIMWEVGTTEDVLINYKSVNPTNYVHHQLDFLYTGGNKIEDLGFRLASSVFDMVGECNVKEGPYVPSYGATTSPVERKIRKFIHRKPNQYMRTPYMQLQPS